MPRRSVTTKAPQNEADTVEYNAETLSNWSAAPKEVGEALDELAAREGAIEHHVVLVASGDGVAIGP